MQWSHCSQIFWLKNRKPSEGRDARQMEHLFGKYIISERPMSDVRSRQGWIPELVLAGLVVNILN